MQKLRSENECKSPGLWAKQFKIMRAVSVLPDPASPEMRIEVIVLDEDASLLLDEAEVDNDKSMRLRMLSVYFWIIFWLFTPGTMTPLGFMVSNIRPA